MSPRFHIRAFEFPTRELSEKAHRDIEDYSRKHDIKLTGASLDVDEYNGSESHVLAFVSSVDLDDKVHLTGGTPYQLDEEVERWLKDHFLLFSLREYLRTPP